MTSISGLWSGVTFVGYATSSNTTTVTSGLTTIASIATQTGTKYYVIGTYTTSVEATFYYSNSNVGVKTNSKVSGTQTRNVYCSSDSAATTSVKTEGTITPPSTTAPYGTSLVGWAATATSMTTTTVTTLKYVLNTLIVS